MFNSKPNIHTMVELLQWRAELQPERKVFKFLDDGENEGSILTFSELDRQARFIGALLQLYTKTGDRALLLYNPGLEFIAAFFGCLYAGVMAVPAYPPRHNRPMPRLQAIITDAAATVVLTEKSVYSGMEKRFASAPELCDMKWIVTDAVTDSHSDKWVMPSINTDSIAFLQYTSGSTSTPKGVIVSHENLLHNESVIQYAYGHTEESTYVSWLPLFHDMGLIGNVLQSVYIGSECILMAPAAFLQKPYRWLHAISRYRAHTSGGPNFGYDLCVRSITEEQKTTLDLSSWVSAFNGSEPVRNPTLERFSRAFASCGFRHAAFYPCYGLAEATLFVTGGSVSDPPVILSIDEKVLEQNRVFEARIVGKGAGTLVGCGHTWLEQEVIIVNPDTKTLCPPDSVGEVWLAGLSNAKGYWRKDEETRCTFQAYLEDTGKGPYLRTGDLGFVKGTELYITGRLKDLIIIRGCNHYPHDIELTVEECHEALRAGCGAAFSIDADGEECLVIVQEVERQYRNKNLDDVIDTIRQAVFKAHEIQVHAIVLVMPGSIAKTSSGKIQRRASRSAYLAGGLEIVLEWKETDAADETDAFYRTYNGGSILHKLIYAISACIGIESSKIDIEKPVIYYGMDSLKAVELAHKIENMLNISIHMSDFFDESSICELAGILQERLSKTDVTAENAFQESEAEQPLSRGQKALWLIHQLQPKNPAYYIVRAMRICGEVNIPALEKAFQGLVDRHAALRTTFTICNGEPVQKISQRDRVCFSLESASLWSEKLLREKMYEAATLPFDLERGPLFRVNLFERPVGEYTMLLSIHHLVADFWSLAILVNELGLLYSAELQGRKAELPLIRENYHDYIRWQEKMLSGHEGEKIGEYWKQQLSGELPVLNLSTDRPRLPVQTYNGRTISFDIHSETLQSIKGVAANTGSSLYMVLLAAFQVLLHRYIGQDDILIGSPAAGREKAGFSNTVGYFTNPLVMRARFFKGQTFIEFLKEVRKTVVDAYRYQNYPFATLVENLRPDRDPSRSPVFQVMFTLQKAQLLDDKGLSLFALGESGASMETGELKLESLELEMRTSQFDLAVSIAEAGGRLAVSIEYNSDLFNEATINRIARHYGNILSEVAAAPGKAISEISFLDKAERDLLLTGWNDTCTDIPYELCIHDLFEKQAVSRPEEIAALFVNEDISYGELNHRAESLARFLKKLGVENNSIVAIYMDRSLDMLVGLLGVLKAGGAYLPLDITYPRERLKYMIDDAGPMVLLTKSSLREDAAVYGTGIVCMDEEWGEVCIEASENGAKTISQEDLAYIIYTSGSTGKPKGVGITHRSVVNFLFSMRKKPGFSEKDTLLSVTTLSFDIVALELFLPLICGGRVVIVPREEISDGAKLIRLIERYSATVMQATPATWKLMLDAGWNGCRNLKILCGGEMLSRELANQLLDRCDSLWNMYGPTETTIWSAVCKIESTDGPVPIGRPIDNTQIYILDSEMEPVPIGVTGELYIGGQGLSPGYFNRPEMTEERFVPNRFDSSASSRIYKTGDLARYLSDGNIEVLGRVDHQVKIRGFRIELGDIEAALDKHPSINESIVSVYEVSADDKRLAAYYTGTGGRPLPAGELRNSLKERLPESMIPSFFIPLEYIPLTPNGKIDRKALPPPVNPEILLQGIYRAPEDEIEETIAIIWKEVLRVDKIGADDRFFDIGGHSLLLASVFNKVKRTLDTALISDLTMVDMFKYPTIRSLASFLKKKKEGNLLKEQPEEYVSKKKKNAGGTADKPQSGEIAIIGMAGRFPGANKTDDFWNNLINGLESIRFFSDQELLSAGVDPGTVKNPDYVKARGVIDNADHFDAAFFGFSPREAEILDPQHRVFLECAWEAMEDAGYVPDAASCKVGLYAGVGLNHYLLNRYSELDLEDSAGNYQLFIGNDKDFVPTRVSYKLNLKGPSINIQTACSSSLVALHLACCSIKAGECDMALAGGVSIRLPQIEGYIYQPGGIPSPDGHCRAFDEKAGGTVFGNGVGIVVLKPLKKALADRDSIYAVIKGTAVNNDGSAKIGFTAPSVEGQTEVIRTALENADVMPDSVTYIEAHGTGTELGDPIEMQALKDVYGKCAEKEFCAVGSVKSNIGHLDTAAGIAGLIKAALALKYKKLPPTLHFNQSNPKLALKDSPFFINDRSLEWEKGKYPRRAGVSSFGIGGTNAHVILEEAPDRYNSGKSRPWQLLTLSARTDTTLQTAASNLADHLSGNPSTSIADAAFTLAKGRKAMNCRRAVLCRSLQDAVELLKTPDMEKIATSRWEGGQKTIAFMFPGQGSQYVGMARELYENETVFRNTVDQCMELLKSNLDIDFKSCLYPDGGSSEEAESRLKKTETAQLALFVIEYATAKLLMEWGLRPWAMIGHSIGEYAAACLAGVFTVEEALLMVAQRGSLMQELPEGAMLAVSIPEEKVREYFKANPEFDVLDIAAVNAASLCTVSGTGSGIAAFEKLLQQEGVICRRLHTSHAFHSHMMDPALQRFKQYVAGINLKPPAIPFISNVSGTWIKPEEAVNPDYWVKHLRNTVRFREGIETLTANDKCILLEVGPGQSLCSLARQVSGRQTGAILSSIRHPLDKQSDEEFILKMLARLWLEGVNIHWDGFYKNEERLRIHLPAYPFERQRYYMDAGKRSNRLNENLTRKRDLADWFYIPSWKRSIPPLASKSVNTKSNGACYLIFYDKLGVGMQIAKRLEKEGHKAVVVETGKDFKQIDGNLHNYNYTIRSGNKGDFEKLFGEITEKDMLPDSILYFWSMDRETGVSSSVEEFQNSRDNYFYSLLYISQALGRYCSSRKVKMTVVTNNLWRVESIDRISPLKSLLLGPVKVAPQEYPTVECRCVDLRLPEPDTDIDERFINRLYTELITESVDKVVSYRGIDRWVQTYEKVKIDTEVKPGIYLKEEGVYLITGGLGGIGLELAGYLAEMLKARLILTGHTHFPPKAQWEKWISQHGELDNISLKIRKVMNMEKNGAKVEILRADVTDIRQMKQVMDKVTGLYRTVHGVIHAAGTSGGGVIHLKTAEAAEAVLKPKVNGTLVLWEAFGQLKPDFFMVCSSITSIAGGFGQVDYTAANAFMDAFAQANAASDGVLYISFNWDRWKGVGMAAGAETPVNGTEAGHPLLDRRMFTKMNGEMYITEFSVEKHWVLSEHAVVGTPTVPGTTYLEMARAALIKRGGSGIIEIQEVVFLVPLTVNLGEKRKVYTSLVNDGDFYEFSITSRTNLFKDGNEVWQEHARGKIRYASQDASPQRTSDRYDIEEIISKYGLKELEISSEYDKKTGELLVRTGGRWNSVRRIYAGTNVALAELELPYEYAVDLQEMKLHPALLDITTGLIQYLGKSGNYLPLAYEKVMVSKPMTGRMNGYLELNKSGSSGGDLISCDVHIFDENGIKQIEIHGFTMRKVSGEALAGLKAMSASTQSGFNDQLENERVKEYVAAVSEIETRQAPESDRAVDTGLTAAEGVEAFGRILSGFTLPQVVISTREIDLVMRDADASEESKILKELNIPVLQKPAHSRPDLESMYIIPGNELEQKIAEIWQRILGIDRVGVHDNFFELGGTSLAGIQVVSEMKKALGADISTVSIFEAPTVSLLAKLLVSDGDKQLFDRAKDRAEKKKDALNRRASGARRGRNE